MDSILCFRKVIQGLASSVYHATAAMRVTLCQAVFDEWKAKNNVDPKKFPYKSYSEIVSAYLDDLLIYTSESLGPDVHLMALDAIFYALQRAKWVIGPAKCEFLTKNIKFLGINVDTEEGVAHMNLERAQAILDIRTPRSIPELISRLSTWTFSAPFIPMCKKLSIPLLLLAKSGKFYWDQACAEAFNEIKFLISLNIKNVIMDPLHLKVIQVDSSRLAMGGVIWQVDSNGQLQLLSTVSTVLSQSQYKSPAIIRETESMMFCIQKFEDIILNTSSLCV